MKKFQNLIENRIRHKNNLLQADVKRLYPINKLMSNGFKPFENDQPKSPKRKKHPRL